MAPLPAIRVREVAPFLHVGIDTFGPMAVYLPKIVPEGSDPKSIIAPSARVAGHGVIFTCLVTRAVHLEIMLDLSGEQFSLALERFCSLRRVPQIILSDNGSQFRFVQPFLGPEVNLMDAKVQAHFRFNRIQWSFIPQYAPWYGGAYELLIGFVKRSLRKSYSNRCLPLVELQTVLHKVADIVNSRPLTYFSTEEVVEPLTPNHFLRFGANINVDLALNAHIPITKKGQESVTKWHLLSRMLDAYWEAFHHLYLKSLTERHVSHHPTKRSSVPFVPKMGDIVLFQETSPPRAEWPMGRILQLDRRAAIAYIRWGLTTCIRPITRLNPLEIASDGPNPTIPENNNLIRPEIVNIPHLPEDTSIPVTGPSSEP